MKSSSLSASLVALGALCLAASASAVGTRRFTLDKEADFKGGDLKGVAVDSRGSVRAGLDLGALPVAEANSIWSALPQKDGSVLLGTGNEGKVLKWDKGKLSELATLKGAQHVFSLAFDAKNNALYAATGPEGKLFRITATGDAQVYFDAEE